MPEDYKQELSGIVSLMKELIRGQEKMTATIEDLVNMFKKYDIEEVMYSEDLREG